MTTGHPTQVETRELFSLLESNNLSTLQEIKGLVLANLNASKEAWLINSLVDYYYASHSSQAQQILTEISAPHDKHLVEKITEGIKAPEHRLLAFRLLLHIVCKQPLWIHKLLSAPVFPSVIKCLRSETDVPVLMSGVMVLTILLPSVPVLIGQHLQELFDTFSHAVAFNVRKPGNVPEVFLIHLQVALYAFFHRLYGMFPYNFLTFLRHFYSKKENLQAYQDFIKPMLERVRLHPHLIDATRESEISQKRWRQMENHDVLVECAKMSLDVLEGTWEELSCPISPGLKLQASKEDDKAKLETGKSFQSHQQGLIVSSQPIASESNLLWSPSLLVGLSTPPPSQRATPATSVLEISNTSNPGTFPGISSTPQVTPHARTPVETPPISEDADSKGKKTNKNVVMQKPVDGRKAGSSTPGERLHISIIPGQSDASRSVPPSPLKVNFISEPPHGAFKAQPQKTAIRELHFDGPNTKVTEPEPIPVSVCHTAARESEPAAPSSVSDTVGNKALSMSDPTGAEEEGHCDLMESFSMDTLPKMIEKLNSDDEDTTDKEVSDLTQMEPPVYLTAESVQKFMRSVNRIRFNSMTASNDVASFVKSGKGFSGQGRSRSCPQLPKVTPEEDDNKEADTVSRPASKPELESKIFNDSESTPQPESDSTEGDRHASDENTTSNVPSSSSIPAPPPVSSSTCPAFDGHLQADTTRASDSSLSELMRQFLMPANLAVCNKCKMRTSNEKGYLGQEAAMFSNLSPPQLLDQYFRLGREVHAKELSKIPITSQESINWTHFGGLPPPDEINILRGQLFMMENQIMYERNKRELHAKRSRRLLRRITNANAMEEQIKVQEEQLSIQATEIKNLQVSLKLLQGENKNLRESKENNEHETRVKLSTCLNEKEELKSAKTELNTLLVRQREEQDKLQKKLQATEAALFEKEKEIVFLKEEVDMAQKLKEQVLQLHQELLLMGELQQKYQEKIHVMKQSNQTKQEQDYLINTLKQENKVLRGQLSKHKVELQSRHGTVSELEEAIKQKDHAIQEMKTKLVSIKVSHDDELQAVDDKYSSLVSIYRQTQSQLLKLYSQLDQQEQPTHSKVLKAVEKKSNLVEETRDRSGSDPNIKPVTKTPLTQVNSVPLSCTMQDTNTTEKVKDYQKESKGHDFDDEEFTVVHDHPTVIKSNNSGNSS